MATIPAGLFAAMSRSRAMEAAKSPIWSATLSTALRIFGMAAGSSRKYLPARFGACAQPAGGNTPQTRTTRSAAAPSRKMLFMEISCRSCFCPRRSDRRPDATMLPRPRRQHRLQDMPQMRPDTAGKVVTEAEWKRLLHIDDLGELELERLDPVRRLAVMPGDVA